MCSSFIQESFGEVVITSPWEKVKGSNHLSSHLFPPTLFRQGRFCWQVGWGMVHKCNPMSKSNAGNQLQLCRKMPNGIHDRCKKRGLTCTSGVGVSKQRSRRRTRQANVARSGLHIRVVGRRREQDWDDTYPAPFLANWADRMERYDARWWVRGTTPWLWAEEAPSAPLWQRMQEYEPPARVPVRAVALHCHGTISGMLELGTDAPWVPALEVLRVVYTWRPSRVVLFACHAAEHLRTEASQQTLPVINPSSIPTWAGVGKLGVDDMGWHEGWELETRCRPSPEDHRHPLYGPAAAQVGQP